MKNENDISKLQKLAVQNKVEVLGNNKYMPLWYTLACSKNSKGNALAMAHLFDESGLFLTTEADLMTAGGLSSVDADTTLCVNDEYFKNQWGLNNTGHYVTSDSSGGPTPLNANTNAYFSYYGTSQTSQVDSTPDIRACQAWQTTKGSKNVIVAVFDVGVQLNHPDLTNMHPVSFDTKSGTSPSKIYLLSHGTNCAGVIGADLDNNIGVAGGSPKSPIMSISHDFTKTKTTVNTAQERANAINFAWMNGASVISNSWFSTEKSTIIESAIKRAIIEGRDGLGAVVVFAAGNKRDSSNYTKYPGNFNDSIIVVGAIDPKGKRIHVSTYGDKLDIMAPGLYIPTVTIGDNYTQTFYATSAAAPHVAAVAALILSVNSNLTQKQVANIIEATAQKVRSDLYEYTISARRQNGSWNDQMGYGLVDADAAVRLAKSMCTTNTPDLYLKDKHNDFGTEPNPDNELTYWKSPDIWIRRQDDGFEKQTDQNLEFRPLNSNLPNYIYVRVRNKGCAPSTGVNKLRLYWAKAATALAWPAPWDGSLNTNQNAPMGDTIATKLIGSIVSGADSIFKYEWYPPNPANYTNTNTQPWHFCLLARIETSATAPYGMTYPETNDLFNNVKSNNNIVWKNVTVMDSVQTIGMGNPGSGTGCVLVKNINPTAIRNVRLSFAIPSEEQNNSILQHAIVKLDLGSKLTKKWVLGGMQGSGVVLGADNLVSILNPNAWIGNIPMLPSEQELICSHVKLVSPPTTEQVNRYSFDIIQSDNGKVVGGERFEVIFDKFPSIARRDLEEEQQSTIVKSTDILIYPNPAIQELYVKTDTEDEFNINITDLVGKELYQNKFTKATSIDISKFAKGLYFIKTINLVTDKVNIKKIAVQ